MTSPSPTDELLELATELAREVARGVLDRRGDGFETLTKSSDVDLVTEVDRWAETTIVGALAERRPDDAVVGEEGTDRPGTSGIVWHVDPIDGTTNFVYGHPGYAVSIAAADTQGYLVGAVADIVAGEVYAAARDRGATLDGRPLRVNHPTDLAPALVSTGFSYDAERRRRQASQLVHVLGEVRDIRRMGSAALDLCAVASGRVDAFYEHVLNTWDYAAGVLIAREAGATVTDLTGRHEPGPGVLAAAPGIHAELVELLARAGAAAPLD